MYLTCMELALDALHNYMSEVDRGVMTPLHEAYNYLFDLCYCGGGDPFAEVDL